MTPVVEWTGREARALRWAWRMSQRAYAGHLGVARSTETWESRGTHARLQPDTQQLLDTDLERAPAAVRERFTTRLANQHNPTGLPVDCAGAPHLIKNQSVVRGMSPGQVAVRRLVAVTSPAHLDEILAHLRDQWHALVRTDNLLAPGTP